MDLTSTSRYHSIAAIVAAGLTLSGCSATSDIGDAGQSAGVAVPSQQLPSVNGTTTGNGVTTGTDTGAGDTGGGSESTAVPDNSSTTPDISAAQNTDTSDKAPEETTPSASQSALVANASSIPCDAAADSFRDTMLAMVKHSRQSAQQCGDSTLPSVGSVEWNDQLATAARNHANDMVNANFFSHTGSDGLGVADRAEGAGYDWRAVGENIAAGQRDNEEVHQGWLDSAGHCRNIMNSSYTEIGAACVANDATDFRTYWVVVFGDQR